ncbi:MAG: hypothetical protein JWR67_2914 [Mucilaginibacter sp.]|nr:hypothetical protein [Mucilaginibacter sp.]MDB5111800.1 hypothetical protein [Mucilaginibacter sp.]
MGNQNIEKQTRIYLFDLMSTAQENGFKAEDNWELSIVSEKDKTIIQKDYYPAVAVKVIPEMLLQVFQSIKTKLNQVLNKEEQLLNIQSVLNDNLSYIVAYSPTRQRR